MTRGERQVLRKAALRAASRSASSSWKLLSSSSALRWDTWRWDQGNSPMTTTEQEARRAVVDSLVWDGVPRIDGWLVDHAGAEDPRAPLIDASGQGGISR